MLHAALQEHLLAYAKVWGEGQIAFPSFDPLWEQRTQQTFLEFLSQHPNALERSCPVGHITGSALVVNPSLDRILLTLHAKLGKWLQLGGHVDGDSHVASSALREACEESGRSEPAYLRWDSKWNASATPLPLDCDIHAIPMRGHEGAHLHFDIRYLCILDDRWPLHITSESKDLRWLSLDEARTMSSEPSMIRQFDKFEALKRARLLP